VSHDTAPPPDDLPRVLLLSDSYPQTIYAGNILLYRLFRGYPAERLMIAGPPPEPEAELLPCRFAIAAEPWTARARLSRARRAVNALIARGCWPRLMFKLPADFQPEIVLSVMQSPRHYNAAARLARRRGLPLGLMIHDIPESFHPVPPFARQRQIESNARVYRQAARRFCVSPWMAELFADRYGAPGQTLYPSRSDDLRPRPPEETATLKEEGVLTLGYAGTLGYGYGNQIAFLSKALRGRPFRINLYSRGNSPVPQDESVVRFRGGASPEETWRRVQAECDATLLPYMFAAEGNRELYSTHFPSKLPEYLALGMPTVALGPAWASGVRWVLEHPGAALTLTEDHPPAWLEALEKLRTDASLRESLARGGLEVGDREFHPVATREHFWQELRAMRDETRSRRA
jgi:glycosyltransferase involved in cell wall biosynthesis